MLALQTDTLVRKASDVHQSQTPRTMRLNHAWRSLCLILSSHQVNSDKYIQYLPETRYPGRLLPTLLRTQQKHSRKIIQNCELTFPQQKISRSDSKKN